MSTAERAWEQPFGPTASPFATTRRRPIHSHLATCWMCLQLAGDYGCIGMIVWLACRAELKSQPSTAAISANAVAALAVLLFRHYQLYEPSSLVSPIHETERILRSAVVTFCAVILAILLHEQHGRAWPALAATMVGAVLAVLLERYACLAMVRWARNRGYGLRRILICGARPGAELFRKLDQNPRLGWFCVGFIDDSTGIHQLCEPRANAEIIGTWEQVREIADREGVDEIILADPHGLSFNRFIDVLNQCDRMNVSVSLLSGAFELYRPWFRFQLHDGMLVACRRSAGVSAVTALAKRVTDVLLASLLLVALGPLMLLIALLIRLDSAGPVLFRQNRIGKDGCIFVIYKFRSMRVDAPTYARSPVSPHDARITRIGRILRRTSFDELPQLFNVLRGEMSLVGPRPEMPFIVAQYGPVELSRLRLKPGITGLWQISPARTAPIHENIEYDLHYVEHQNFFLDLAILLSTVTAVIRGAGAH